MLFQIFSSQEYLTLAQNKLHNDTVSDPVNFECCVAYLEEITDPSLLQSMKTEMVVKANKITVDVSLTKSDEELNLSYIAPKSLPAIFFDKKDDIQSDMKTCEKIFFKNSLTSERY